MASGGIWGLGICGRGSTATPAIAAGRGRKGGGRRWSLRRLFYTNPLLSPPFSRSPKAENTRPSKRSQQSRGSPPRTGTQARSLDAQSEASNWVGMDRESPSSSVVAAGASVSLAGSEGAIKECPLCYCEEAPDQFVELRNCGHQFCLNCLQKYVRIEIQEGRVNLKCPQCTEGMHPNDISLLCGEDHGLLLLYESLMMRRVLAQDPDTRWCPAPNCTFAVVAAGCASCPRISCEREGCEASFCYHCKAEWHPNQTCDLARAQRQPLRASSVSFSQDSGLQGGGSELKVCPRCSVLIVKMDDGSCNHMTCAVCGSEFCWLCMKEISDLHYLSPSGCTFWGKKPWSRKKKLLWQLGTLVGAPVGIALIAGISIPALLIGVPVWVGRKIHGRYQSSGRHQRNLAITSGVTASILVTPVLAGLAVSIGVPILLAYVYGVVPISLCRSGGCGVHTSSDGVTLDVEEDGGAQYRVREAQGGESQGPRVANPSIGEVSLGASLSMGSGSHLDRVGCVLQDCDRESASNTAMAGYSLTGSVASSYLGHQRLEVGADVHSRKKFSFSSERLSETVSLSEKSATVSLAEDGASTRALAGSLLGYRLDASSVCSYRATGVQTPGSCGSAGLGTPGGEEPGREGYSGDEISLKSMPGNNLPRSLSPVHITGEELTAAVRRSRRRQGLLEKQESKEQGEEEGDQVRWEDQGALERVRFDDKVSFIEALHSPPGALGGGEESRAKSRLELEVATVVREETAEELALVSPLPSRQNKQGDGLAKGARELTLWAKGSLEGDEAPLLCSPSLTPSSPFLPGTSPPASTDCHNVSNITVLTDADSNAMMSNVTSISIEPEQGTFSSEMSSRCHQAATDNVAFVNCEAGSMENEPIRIKVGGTENSKSEGDRRN